MLTKPQIRAAVENVLRHVQTTNGRVCPAITDATRPIGELDAFDSLMGVEATVLIEQELHCTLADGTAFVSATGSKHALSVAEIVERIGAMLVPTRAA